MAMVRCLLTCIDNPFITAWMCVKRKHVVVQAGQPEFLALVAIGCLIATSAVSLISYID